MYPVAHARTAQLHRVDANKNGVDPRLKPAAHEFEASLLQELLAPMEHDPLFSTNSSGAGLMTGDAGMDTWSGLATQSLAKAISDAGGLGLAAKMMQEVEAEAKDKGAASKITDAGAASKGKGLSLSTQNAHLHAWSTVRRLP